MELTLESLGITKEELQEKVVDRMCEQILLSTGYDEDGNTVALESSFHRTLTEKVKAHVDVVIGAIAEKSVLPNVTKYIEELCLQETTKWGQKVGAPVTFVEYLVQRADAYIKEEVDRSGESKSEARSSYDWRARSTRVAYLINSHLQASIEQALTKSLGLATKTVKEGLEVAVKMALDSVKVTVNANVDTGK